MDEVSAQPALFLTLHPDCGGLGFVPDPEEPEGSGFVIPCAECNPDGERHYDPWLAEVPF